MNTQNPAEKPITPERIMGMAWGYAPPLIIGAAIKAKMFDALASGAKPADGVARDTGNSPRGTRMILNALVSLELLKKDGDRYSLAPEADQFLVTTKPGFQGGLFRHMDTQLIPHWLKLSEVVRSGAPDHSVNEQEAGSAFFQQFVEDIFPMSFRAAQALASYLNVAAATKTFKVLDLAAGSGVWGITLAQASREVQVTAVDWPNVLPVTRRVAERFGIAKRIDFVGSDILEASYATDFDLVVLGHILHSEGSTRAQQILQKSFDALRPGGKIAIAEFLANDTRTGPPMAMIFAINMLVNTDEGDTFTFTEISRWLKDAGFANPRTFDAPGPSPLILADKP